MCHALRQTMTTDGTGQAFRALNIEPSYDHCYNPAIYRHPTHPPSSTELTPYFVKNEELNFDPVSRMKKVSPKPISWAAHWPAVEGIQSLISEKPPLSQRTRKSLLF